jgi:hypothetical protein
MGAGKRFAIVVPAVVGLAWATMSAVDTARVDAPPRAASTEMSSWAAAGTQPAEQTWISVREDLDAALRIRPHDPTIHELLGMLGSMRRDSSRHLDDAVAHLTTAIALRPVSPYTWAHLAQARYVRGDGGAQIDLPLARAASFGPSEPGIQRIVADLGLAVWRDLTPATRAQVDRMVAAGMRRNPLEMLRISDRRGRLEAACRHVIGMPTRDPRVGRHCDGWEITP